MSERADYKPEPGTTIPKLSAFAREMLQRYSTHHFVVPYARKLTACKRLASKGLMDSKPTNSKGRMQYRTNAAGREALAGRETK